jgi:thiol-disulfide isomerase/thioredoxin
MRKYLLFLLGISAMTGSAQQFKSDSTILSRTAARLQMADQLSYHYALEINNYKEDNFYKDTAACYLEFDRQSGLLARFQTAGTQSFQVYNGAEYFYLNKKEKLFELDNKAGQKKFSSLIVMVNAIPVLKRSLEYIIKDDSIPKIEYDTLIAEKAYKVINMALKNKAMDYADRFRKFSVSMTVYYELIVDPVSFLPYQLIEHNSADQQAYNVRVTFTRINEKPRPPTASSWYYSSYEKEYKRKIQKKAIPLIAIGAKMPEWTLPQMGTESWLKAGDSHMKDKVVLFDFWIKNCGYCMESFPKLKALQEKYGNENVEILTINAHDEKKEVDFFFKREKPAYKMLYQGEELAKTLGVDDRGYPTVLITNTSGKVIYAGSFEKEKIDKLIREAISLNLHGGARP